MPPADSAPSPRIVHLHDLVLSAMTEVAGLDYADCCVARKLVGDLQFKILHALVERYDVADEEGFATLARVGLALFSDQREAARYLGASVSTLNRWKSGATIPHALVRVSIQGAILRRLDAEQAPGMSPLLRGPHEDQAVARTITH